MCWGSRRINQKDQGGNVFGISYVGVFSALLGGLRPFRVFDVGSDEKWSCGLKISAGRSEETKQKITKNIKNIIL